MPAVVRLGDICTGHAGWPPRPNDSASPDTRVNNIPVHRKGDHWVTHCKPRSGCHDGVLAAGSPDCYVNNRPVGRIGDPVSCGSRCATGSPDCFVDGR